jgi:hypothetical protein
VPFGRLHKDDRDGGDGDGAGADCGGDDVVGVISAGASLLAGITVGWESGVCVAVFSTGGNIGLDVGGDVVSETGSIIVVGLDWGRSVGEDVSRPIDGAGFSTLSPPPLPPP